MSFDLILEVPLAIASLIFYKVMKLVIGNLYTLYLSFNKKITSQWRVLSAEALKSPLSLPVLMTKGPRWNTHAVIGTLGPFSVKESLSLDVDSINLSAQSWIAVVYDFPAYRTITSLTSQEYSQSQGWISVKLASGKYSLGVRYYNCRESLWFPAVKTDAQELVSSYFIPSDVNQFYSDLISKKNWFYLALHYYIYTILRLRKWLPESFVKSEFLPVGAPDTQFFYDYITKQQSLQVIVKPEILSQVDIYLTIYDRSSLPLAYAQLGTEKYLSQPIPNNGYYLIRVRQKTSPLDLTGQIEINKID